jgi:hypothetical protein
MNTQLLKSYLLVGAATLALLSPLSASAADDLEQALIKDGIFFGEVRYRYENVDQEGFTEDASASTVRLNVGYKTGVYENFQGLAEAQLVQEIGSDNFNSTTNGNTAYPTVADPDGLELNRAWVAWTGLQDTTIKVGRQAVNLDNQRFIGTVGWRQNDQTYDAAAIINSSIPNLNLLYAFVGNVNRIQGNDHSLGDLDTETHLANTSYSFTDWLSATAYGYWLDIDLAPSLSSKTYGLRLTGDAPISDTWSFFYTAEAAMQSEYGNNTNNYNEHYYHIVPGVKGYGFTLQAGYEELGGDGTNSFQTPLATGHKFNGWADKFLSTPNAGLEDAYAKISYTVSNANKWVNSTKLTAVYHEFNGDSSGNFGSEIDLSVGKTFNIKADRHPFKNISVLVKYSDYEADDAPFKDTEKFWFQIGTKF